jgi:hypothetical protein
MNNRWFKAAERYEAAKQPDFKVRKKRPEPKEIPESLASFLANGEGETARKLLAASGRDICLGYSEAVMSRTTAVIIDGEGLKTYSGVVGMAAAYTKETPRKAFIKVADALDFLRSFPKEGNLLESDFDEKTLVANIRKQLDAIAADAP